MGPVSCFRRILLHIGIYFVVFAVTLLTRTDCGYEPDHPRLLLFLTGGSSVAAPLRSGAPCIRTGQSCDIHALGVSQYLDYAVGHPQFVLPVIPLPSLVLPCTTGFHGLYFLFLLYSCCKYYFGRFTQCIVYILSLHDPGRSPASSVAM